MDSARKIVRVPAAGICSRALRADLGLSTAEVNPLLGDEIVCPRDYRRSDSADIFNIDGVRRLVRLLDLADVEVLAEGEPIPDRIERLAGPRPTRLPHYMRDLSED